MRNTKRKHKLNDNAKKAPRDIEGIMHFILDGMYHMLEQVAPSHRKIQQ